MWALLSCYSNQSMGARDSRWSLRGHSLPYLWLGLLTLRCRMGPGGGRVSGQLAKKDTDKWEPSQRGELEAGHTSSSCWSQQRPLPGGPSKSLNTWKDVASEEENLFFVGMDNTILGPNGRWYTQGGFGFNLRKNDVTTKSCLLR